MVIENTSTRYLETWLIIKMLLLIYLLLKRVHRKKILLGLFVTLSRNEKARRGKEMALCGHREASS